MSRGTEIPCIENHLRCNRSSRRGPGLPRISLAEYFKSMQIPRVPSGRELGKAPPSPGEHQHLLSSQSSFHYQSPLIDLGWILTWTACMKEKPCGSFSSSWINKLLLGREQRFCSGEVFSSAPEGGIPYNIVYRAEMNFLFETYATNNVIAGTEAKIMSTLSPQSRARSNTTNYIGPRPYVTIDCKPN